MGVWETLRQCVSVWVCECVRRAREAVIRHAKRSFVIRLSLEYVTIFARRPLGRVSLRPEAT